MVNNRNGIAFPWVYDHITGHDRSQRYMSGLRWRAGGVQSIMTLALVEIGHQQLQKPTRAEKDGVGDAQM